jgi:hypothetical protein
VSIEFRDTIGVQYFQGYWPQANLGGWTRQDDPFHGQWVTAKIAESRAGDRGASFTFVPYSEEQPGKDVPTVRYRRTYRVRFLLGRQQPSPIRNLRAYGPSPVAQATFDVHLEEASPLKTPLKLSVVNGAILTSDADTPTESP